MRIDAIAYQRATRVAVIGLFLQFAIGLTLLLFGLVAGDDVFTYASVYVFIGLLTWLALVIVFNQHKLERLESLESDELQQQRMGATGSAFDSESEEFNVASRRLRLMHKWLMPIVTWISIILLALLALGMLNYLRQIHSPTYQGTGSLDIIDEAFRGWGLAICLGLATLSFICSRFVAGMSKQPAWQNLRGGAGYMVGNALVTLAVGAGIIFTYFDNEAVMRAVAYAIPIFMLVLAAEFVLNFLLNLYSPRRAGEVPRPAFDSRLLSLLSAPDSIVKSINEAINYQFGFDITSSWGYQLLLRAAWKLGVIAIIIMVLLNCMVVVEPQQQAVRLRGGEIKQVAESGLMWKLPWPIETAEVYDISRVRTVPLTLQLREPPHLRNEPILWAEGFDDNLGIEPFMVAATSGERVDVERQTPGEMDVDVVDEEDRDDASAQQAAVVSQEFALVEAGFELAWRIKPDDAATPGANLERFLRFASSVIEPRQPIAVREAILQSLALREVTRYLSTQGLDAVIANERAAMIQGVQAQVQQVFDEYQTGVEVVAILNPWIRPAGDAGTKFEELSFNLAARKKEIANAERQLIAALTSAAGGPANADALLAAIGEYQSLSQEGAGEADLNAQRERIEALMLRGGGVAGTTIAEAYADRWSDLLLAQARLEKFKGRLAPYRAGQEVYMQYLLMDTLSYSLARGRKFFFGVDPDSIDINIEMLQDDQMFEVGDVLGGGGDSSDQ